MYGSFRSVFSEHLVEFWRMDNGKMLLMQLDLELEKFILQGLRFRFIQQHVNQLVLAKLLMNKK